MGTVFVRWKWAGMILIILLCGLGGGMVGLAGSMTDGNFLTAKTLEVASHLTALPWWLLAAAAVSLALDVGFQWMLLRRQEVKL